MKQRNIHGIEDNSYQSLGSYAWPIRVLQILPGGASKGGIESFVMSYYRNVDRDAIQFDFLVHYQSEKWFLEDEIKDLGGRVFYCSAREDKDIASYVAFLRRFFCNYPEFSIVHGHMPGFAPIYFSVAKECGCPIRISHCHVTATEPTLKGRLLNHVIHVIPKTANVHWACSFSAGKYMYGNSGSFEVIPNAISLERFRPDNKSRKVIREALGISTSLVMGCVGRFSLQKNQLFAIEVLQALLNKNVDAKLLLIGEGDMRQRIASKVEKLGLRDNVVMIGYRNNIEDYYRAMDVCLIPSIFEGLSITAIEAQACGVPCVMSTVVPVEASITSAVQLVDLERTADEWADAVLEIVATGVLPVQNDIKRAGYDIRSAAQLLTCKYLDLYLEALEMRG